MIVPSSSKLDLRNASAVLLLMAGATILADHDIQPGAAASIACTSARPGALKMSRDEKTPPRKAAKPSSDNDLVLTPAGALPNDKVHFVAPGKVVRHNPDGSYAILPPSEPPVKGNGHDPE